MVEDEWQRWCRNFWMQQFESITRCNFERATHKESCLASVEPVKVIFHGRALNCTKLNEFHKHCCQMKRFVLRSVSKLNATFIYHLGCLLKFSQSSHSYLIPYHKKIGTTNPSILYMGQRPWKSIVLHYKSGSARVDKRLPFVASVQHARNTNPMIQCEECEMCMAAGVLKLQVEQVRAVFFTRYLWRVYLQMWCVTV